jgi:hypothetical protein
VKAKLPTSHYERHSLATRSDTLHATEYVDESLASLGGKENNRRASD